MKDITGREVKVGDILAIGQRSGNSGHLVIRVIASFHTYKDWRDKDVTVPKTTIGTRVEYPERAIIVPRESFIGTNMEEEVNKELAKIK